MSTTPTTVQDYLAAQPDEVRPVLESVRAAILAAVPGAQEGMRYQMPVVTLDGTYVVHYSAWKHHLGLYPVPRAGPGARGRAGRPSLRRRTPSSSSGATRCRST